MGSRAFSSLLITSCQITTAAIALSVLPMATPKSVSAADLVPLSKLKLTVLSPYVSDGTGLHGQVGLRLDELPAAPTAVGVAVGVAPRVAPRHELKIWVLFCLSIAAIWLCTMIIPDLATIPVWLRLLCRLINFCLCCPVLYFWNKRATDPLRCRFLCGFIIVNVAYFISAAKLIFDPLIFEPDGATADTVVRLTIVGVLVALSPCIFPPCCKCRRLRGKKDWLPTSCLKTESTAEETKTPVVTVAVRHS